MNHTIQNDRDAHTATHTLTVQVAVLSALLTTALQTMSDQEAGYSPRASGSGGGGGSGMAITVAGDRVPVTGVEMQALADLDDDRARIDRASLFHHLGAAVEALRLAGAIATRYGEVVRPNVTEALGIIDSIWCPNCAKHDHFTPRGAGGKRALCNWCDNLQRALGFPPDQPLVDLHARGRRVSEADVSAAKARHEHELEAARRQAKLDRKAAKVTRGSSEENPNVTPATSNGVLQVSDTALVGVVGADTAVRERGSEVEHVSDMVQRFTSVHTE